MSTEDEPTTVAETTTAPATKEELLTKLTQLKALATQQYALKNYAEAAETYSEAAEVQDEINGEMATENAELLYQYGRCLYHLGVSKSDVLGGRVAQQEEPKRKKRKITKDEGTEVGSSTSEVKAEASAANDAPSKPFFQITGDENWTDSEEEDEAEAEEAEEEDDDLAIAYEILDTARVLLHRKLKTVEENTSTGSKHDQELRALRERLADTHDLQAEIKLENEQFADAVNDAQQALSFKLALYPQESGLIAEAHYKLSIALDFAAMPTQTEDADGKPIESSTTDDERAEMRKQAAKEMEKAILSCQARIKKEETLLADLTGTKLGDTKRSIADAKDMVQDMKNRLVDLRNPVSNAADELDAANPLKGLLGEMLGQSKVDQLKMLAQATEKANDLSGMIKKKKPKTEPEVADSKNKRKLEDVEEESAGKKVKFDDA